MILLLVVAIAVVAALAYGGTRMSRSRARQRRESAARAREAAQAAARARAEQEQRQPMRNEDDALTFVMPAIKLPWSSASPLADRRDDGYPGYSGGTSYNPHTVFAEEYPPASPGGNGFQHRERMGSYADLDADYPAFSTLTPFQAEDEPARPEPFPAADHRPADGYRQAAAQYPGSQAGAAEETAGDSSRFGEFGNPPAYPAAYPAERFGLGHRPGDQVAPRPGDYDIPRSRPAERLAPAARPGEQHDTTADRARRRAGQGSHRAEHAKRRRS
jgi:type II secretory pathway pseudopilin PulG